MNSIWTWRKPSSKGHGRRERRHLEASTRLAGHFDWPGLEQVCRLTRTTRRDGKWTTEIDYAVTSVPRSLAGAAELLRCWRGHWDIENRSHYVRDVTFQEDACRIRTGSPTKPRRPAKRPHRPVATSRPYQPRRRTPPLHLENSTPLNHAGYLQKGISPRHSVTTLSGG